VGVLVYEHIHVINDFPAIDEPEAKYGMLYFQDSINAFSTDQKIYRMISDFELHR